MLLMMMMMMMMMMMSRVIEVAETSAGRHGNEAQIHRHRRECCSTDAEREAAAGRPMTPVEE